MKSKSLQSTCLLCNSKYSIQSISKHLNSCIPQTLNTSIGGGLAKTFFHACVRGHGAPEYLLNILLSYSACLIDLDDFLRDIWLECCGHMSAFRFKGNEISKSKKIKDIFDPGLKLIHEYDFGSTTMLEVKFISKKELSIKKSQKVLLIARNDPLQILCDNCNERIAKNICAECQYDGEGWLCEECSKIHKCDEEMFLPVVNSPRAGVCAYTG